MRCAFPPYRGGSASCCGCGASAPGGGCIGGASGGGAPGGGSAGAVSNGCCCTDAGAAAAATAQVTPDLVFELHVHRVHRRLGDFVQRVAQIVDGAGVLPRCDGLCEARPEHPALDRSPAPLPRRS